MSLHATAGCENSETGYGRSMRRRLSGQNSKEMDGVAQRIAPAFYPEKEAWKGQPGNRYTAEELREMERNWEVHLFNPHRANCRSVD